MPQTKADSVPLVNDPDDMLDETFLLHFEKRHSDQLPGIKGFVYTIYDQQPELIETYRKFHDRIHDLIPSSMLKEPHVHE